MRALLTALAAGLLFGLGLTGSGMIDPARVLGFLDVAGIWDPTLAFVMAGAVPVAMLGFRLTRHRSAPCCASEFQAPTRSAIDRSLVAGAILFGIGWGLVGYCPGPALAALGLGRTATGIFVGAMLAGMAIFEIARRRWPWQPKRESR
ncbi:MAG: YeeE/YedE family protein [Azospirillaceae bacterium]|nr:YeeE/YedE family protein [Azospirillaceae bacterium]